jgi:subtilase family serine protease
VGYTAGSWISETAWNEGPIYGDFQPFFGSTAATGGGYSTVWGGTPYQMGTAGLHGSKSRGVPDVAYDGSVFHGVLVPLGPPIAPSGFYRFGGTSAGAPQWAALTALLDQQAGHDYGFINAALYKIGQNSGAYAAAFHDVTVGQNNALEFDASSNPVLISGFNAGTSWDATTGLGSPQAGGLLSQLAAFWSSGQGTAAINNSK